MTKTEKIYGAVVDKIKHSTNVETTAKEIMELFDVELGDWGIGKHVRITDNKSEHEFEMGEVVRIIEPSEDDGYWFCSGLSGRWHVSEGEGVLVKVSQ
jgi:hypothetical protein